MDERQMRRSVAEARSARVGTVDELGGVPPTEAGGPVMAVDIEEWSGWAYSA